MTTVDRLLQNWRLRVGLRHLRGRPRVIDVGAHEGELFHALGRDLHAGFGIEPLQRAIRREKNYVLHPGLFPAVRPEETGWDAITLFAVLEHIPRSEQAALADACHELLREHGRIVITVPSQAVDRILWMLRSLRLIDGMSLEQHFGFEVGETARIFAPPRFSLIRHEVFQLGLNHLFVFEKTSAAVFGPPAKPVKSRADAHGKSVLHC